MSPGRASDLTGLLDLPVRHRGITLGHVEDVLVDSSGAALGLEVVSVAEEHVFLPEPSFDLGADEVLVPAPLALLSEQELAYYRQRSRSLRESLETDADAPNGAGGLILR